MTKTSIAVLVAAALAVSANTSPAAPALAPYYSGVVVGTKAGSCGMQLGEYAFVQYVPHDEGAETPSKLLVQTEGASIYLENKSLTDEFFGGGKATATVTFNFASFGGGFPPLGLVKANATYNITLDSTDPNMLKLSPGKINIAIPQQGLCQFNVRGVLTPSPAPSSPF